VKEDNKNNQIPEEDSEKPEAGEIELDPNSFAGKLSNFWYYEKWKILIAVAAVLLVIVFCLQTCENSKTELTVMYAGSCYMSRSEIDEFSGLLSGFMPAGSGEKSVDVCQLHIFSDEQLIKRIEEDGNDSVTKKMNQEELNSFDNLILAGEYSIVIVEPWLYQRVAKAGGFRKLADVCGKLPENAYDDYSVKLCDTALYKANPELFAGYTADTLICLRTQSQIAGNTSTARYNKSCALFVELIKQ